MWPDEEVEGEEIGIEGKGGGERGGEGHISKALYLLGLSVIIIISSFIFFIFFRWSYSIIMFWDGPYLWKYRFESKHRAHKKHQ